ncbi:MAG: hypothetical protein KKD44_17295 [Proteobacteria bacterium]|nr:hypothetical protein [Pseudomonadota bacterium]
MKHLAVVLTLITLIVSPARADEFDDGYASGKSAGASLSGELDSPEKLNQRLAEPLTSNRTPMETFGENGTHTFDAQISTASSSAFLELFAAPGPRGGLSTLMVNIDTDLNSSYDTTYTCPLDVAGVCANGIISCTRGTWDNCTYHRWVNTGGIGLAQVASMEDMAGCYCINNSCGSNLVWTNMEKILGDLGGGVVAVIQADNPALTVTKVNVSDTTIGYYGQETAEAGETAFNGSGVYLSGTTEPVSLYDPTGDFLAHAGDAELNDQTSDTASLYTQVYAGTQEYVENPVEADTCFIKRRVYVNENLDPVATIRENCSDVDMALCQPDREDICDYKGKNCVTTMKMGQVTGLMPLPQSTTVVAPDNSAWAFTVDGDAMTYTNALTSGTLTSGNYIWWTIKREFVCDSTHVYDTDTGITHTQGITNSVDEASGNLIYTDNGSSVSMAIHQTETITPCEMGCTVATGTQNLQVGATATTWEYNLNTDDTRTCYKSCIDNTCPLSEGEVLVRDCQCLNDFTTAASTMQSIDDASHDMICSGN